MSVPCCWNDFLVRWGKHKVENNINSILDLNFGMSLRTEILKKIIITLTHQKQSFLLPLNDRFLLKFLWIIFKSSCSLNQDQNKVHTLFLEDVALKVWQFPLLLPFLFLKCYLYIVFRVDKMCFPSSFIPCELLRTVAHLSSRLLQDWLGGTIYSLLHHAINTQLPHTSVIVVSRSSGNLSY